MNPKWLSWIIELPMMADVLLKMTVLLALAWAVHFALRRANPRWRVLLWRGVSVGLMAIPFLVAALPSWKVPVAPSQAPPAVRVLSPREMAEPSHPPTVAAPTFAAPTHEPVGYGEREQPTAAAPTAAKIMQRPSFWLEAWVKRSWTWIVLGVWVLFASALAFRFCIGWRRVRRMVTSAAPAAGELRATLAEIAHTLRIARPAEVRVSNEIPSPFLTGLRRPVLVLPKRMAQQAYSSEVRGILAHELSHLRSNDLLWGCVVQWLSIALWFHPLVWRIRHAHASACEEVSDAITADLVGDARAYSRTLARVALEMSHPSPAVGGIPMARGSNIIGRLKALKRRVFRAPLARSAVVVSILGGLLATLLLGCSRLVYRESAEPGALEVLVIDDNDPDYENPPFNDTLYLIGANGKVIKTISGFNTCQSAGGWRAVALANDGSPVVCELAAQKMSKYDPDGNLAFCLDQYLVAVDISGNGDLYCLLSSGTIQGGSVLIIDPVSGDTRKKAEYGGIDLVIDDKNDSLWIVGADIKRLNMKLEEVFTIDPVGWSAVSVDYASDGSAWIAEREHPDVARSKDRLLKVSLDGKILRTIGLRYSPFCLAVDRQNDNVWVAGTRGVYKYNRKGKGSRISRGRVFGVRVNPRDHSVWVAGGNLRHYSAEGKLLSTIHGFSKSDQFIAIRKWGGEESHAIEAKAEGAEVPVSSPPEQEPKLTATKAPGERGRIRGVVLNADTGEPVAGAQVTIGHHLSEEDVKRIREQGAEGALQVNAETDGEGRFVLEGLAFWDYHLFSVECPGFVSHEEWVPLRREKPEIETGVRLKPACSVTVKVVGAEGMPALGQVVRIESRDGHALLPARGDWRPELPYRAETAKMGTCSFEGLAAGDYSVEAMGMGLSETVHHGAISTVSVKEGETKEIELRRADHGTIVRVKVQKDPHTVSPWAALLVISRNPGVLAWAGRNFYHLEDARLARLMQYTLNTVAADSPKDTGLGAILTSDAPYAFRNFPPGTYAVLAITWGKHQFESTQYEAAYIRGAKVEISAGTELTIELPWTEPEGPSPINPRVLNNRVGVEGKQYTAQEICNLIVRAVEPQKVSAWGAEGEVVADSLIRDEKVAFPAGEMSLWELIERTYLYRGWRLETDFEAKRLVLRPEPVGRTAKEEGQTRGRIRGVVVKANTGEPISGAYVAVDHSGDAGGSNLGRFREEGIYVTTETDERGRFLLDGVAFHDNHPFMVTHPGFVRHQETIALWRDQPEMDVKVPLRPAATIVAKVVDDDGKLLQEDAILRLEAGDGRPFFPMREDWPDLPYRTETTKTGTFSFGELDTGVFSIEVMRARHNEVIYHATVSGIAIQAGETTEVHLKPADHRSSVRLKIEKDPYASLGESKGATAILLTRKPGLLAWAGRNFYHPEDERLGRVWKSALVMAVLVPVADAETLQKLNAADRLVSVSKEGHISNIVTSPDMTYTLRNFPPGEYAVFTYAMGMYKDWKSPAVYLRGAKALFFPGRVQAAEIPWVEPIGPSPFNPRVFKSAVELEAKEYRSQEICDLFVKAIRSAAGERWDEDAEGKIVADASIPAETVRFRAGKLSMWDFIEHLYLQKGWILEGDFKAKAVILRPSAPSNP